MGVFFSHAIAVFALFQFWCCSCDALAVLVIVLILVLFSLQHSCFFHFSFGCCCLCNVLADLVVSSILVLLFVQCSWYFGCSFDFGVVFSVMELLFFHCFNFGVVVCSTLFLIWSLFQFWCCLLLHTLDVMFWSLFVRHSCYYGCCFNFGVTVCLTCCFCC